MNIFFNKCADAIKYTNETNTYGLYYSQSQNADKNIHVHECCEILLCLSGGKNFLINDRIYEVNDGDIFIINPFEPHKISSNENETFKRFVLQIHPLFIYNNSTEKTDLSKCFYIRGDEIYHKISLSTSEINDFQIMINRLVKEEEFGDDVIKNSVMIQFLAKLNQIFLQRCADIKYEPSSENTVISQSVKYINEHLAEDLSLEIIANQSFISVNQLCRLFKKHLGTTVTKYIISKRITEAKLHLKAGKSVSETASICGFSDYANFIRTFKNIVGKSPGKYITR